jgi:hypothetical protein
MLDVFNQDAFSMISLTAAIMKAPYRPSRIGSLGLFTDVPISTTTAVVEEKDGQLTLIQTTPRGAPGSSIGASPRTARSFLVPHLQREATILADQIQNVRVFGSENELEAVQAVVNQYLTNLRAMHEVTFEYHRVGAIKGVILNADGVSTIYNLFTEFGIAQQTIDFALSNAATDVRARVVAALRLSESELGAEPVTGYRAFCGDTFFDAFIAHAKVVTSVQYQESQLLRTDLRAGFEYGGVAWENYRGNVGGIPFFPTAEAFIVPMGTNLFKMSFAPADFVESVNQLGPPIYAKIAPDAEFNRWVKVHTQSNPLALCLRPRAVINVTMS